jgi:hypothetical protein
MAKADAPCFPMLTLDWRPELVGEGVLKAAAGNL